MKLSKIDFISTGLGDFIADGRDLTKLNIIDELTKFFKNSTFDIVSNLGFSYTKPQYDKIMKLIESDENAISKINLALNAKYEPDLIFLWTSYKDFTSVKNGKFKYQDVKKLSNKELLSLVGIIEQTTQADYTLQECNAPCLQVAQNFSKQVAHEVESSQKCGDYSIQDAVNYSTQTSGSFCEVFGGSNMTQTTQSNSTLIASNDSVQIGIDNNTFVASEYSKQQCMNNNHLTSANKSEVDCGDNCVIITDGEVVIKSGNNTIINGADKYSDIKFSTIRVGHNSLINIDYGNVLNCGDDCIIRCDDKNDIKCGNNTKIHAIGDYNTITLNGDNMVINNVGMHTTIIINSSYGNFTAYSNEHFPEFSDLVIENGVIITQ